MAWRSHSDSFVQKICVTKYQKGFSILRVFQNSILRSSFGMEIPRKTLKKLARCEHMSLWVFSPLKTPPTARRSPSYTHVPPPGKAGINYLDSFNVPLLKHRFFTIFNFYFRFSLPPSECAFLPQFWGTFQGKCKKISVEKLK